MMMKASKMFGANVIIAASAACVVLINDGVHALAAEPGLTLSTLEGCGSKDCAPGYECNGDYQCVRSTHDVGSLVEDDMKDVVEEPTKKVGCMEDSDCRRGQYCDDMRVCQRQEGFVADANPDVYMACADKCAYCVLADDDSTSSRTSIDAVKSATVMKQVVMQLRVLKQTGSPEQLKRALESLKLRAPKLLKRIITLSSKRRLPRSTSLRGSYSEDPNDASSNGGLNIAPVCQIQCGPCVIR